MARDEAPDTRTRVSVETRLSGWLYVLPWLAVTAAVCWCGYATWCEDAADRMPPATPPALDLTLFCTHPAIQRWLPVTGAFASLLGGFLSVATRHSCARFLVTAAALVSIKALTLAIEAMLKVS
jgi:hypothetical protein